MGALEYNERASHDYGSWNLQRGGFHKHNSIQNSAVSLAAATVPSGLTEYRTVSDKDFDRLSGYSSDDTYSNADSIFDTLSVTSSQSSSSAHEAETFDDALDVAEPRALKHQKPVPEHQHTVRGELEDLHGLLTGLEAKASTNITHDLPPSSEVHSEHVAPTQHETSEPARSNRRRSGSHASISGPPCRLKRDTESADCFVMLLITFAARLITAIWPLSASPPMMSSCFNGAGVLPLEVFIHETLRRSKTSYSTLQVALFYIILLKDKLSDRDFTKEQLRNESGQPPRQCRAMQCGRRMFLAALMLASKYLQDRNYSTRAWSKISGLRIPEINENETHYLKCIDYNLHMKKEAFENWSKIVLTLSRLTKLQPGCGSKLDSLGKPDAGPDAILTAMASDAAAAASSKSHGPYSHRWWCELLKKLDPDIVANAEDTDDFLHNYIPVDVMTDILARDDGSLLTPPTSPESSTAPVRDMTFHDTLPSSNNQTPKLPTPAEMRAPSPARGKVLPIRPQPRNLPTPQSTPRSTEANVWIASTNNQQQKLRCSASLDALRAMPKQCIANANLERCPPPQRPQSLNLPPSRTMARPAESYHSYNSRSSTPATSSPLSAGSTDHTTRNGRSRQSSISSNASTSSGVADHPYLKQRRPPSQTPSPLTRVVSMPVPRSAMPDVLAGPTTLLRRKPNFTSDPTLVTGHRSGSKGRSFLDEGYHSGEDHVTKTISDGLQSGDEADAIQALMSMSSVDKTSHLQRLSAQSTQSPRGHKRTISKTNDTLHDHVSKLLQSRTIDDQVMEDLRVSSHQKHTDKGCQKPNKSWALSKKPAPNEEDTKRMAVYCAMQQGPSASELASRYLKDQMITA